MWPSTARENIGLLDSGVSVGAVTVMAADSSQNATHIDLIGLAATGLAYP